MSKPQRRLERLASHILRLPRQIPKTGLAGRARADVRIAILAAGKLSSGPWTTETKKRRRGGFKHFHSITTRWKDNDIYGHVNNVVYYSFFDSAINAYLIKHGGLDPWKKTSAVGFCVESKCTYYAPIRYPEQLEVGIRVTSIGRSSVRYELGIFKAASGSNVSQDELSVAVGYFVHVFVDSDNGRPTSIPTKLLDAVKKISSSASSG
mmetsp:Transcript_2387/g.5453  ORF Transcript_2387/g.5453 Transcript_2387/m.5453 type:complete len:208 (-) Transcript_2387:112-735(-)